MNRKIILPIVIIACLIIVLFVVLQGPGEYSRTGVSENMLVTYDSTLVDKLEISSLEMELTLEKIDGTWHITSPLDFPAAEFMVSRAVRRGMSIPLISLVSTNPEKQHLFEVDSIGTLVTVYEGGVETAAFWIGKTTTSFTDTYVRKVGSDKVYIAAGTFAGVYDRQPEDWRDKAIFRAPRSSITDIRYSYDESSFSVTKGDTTWEVDGTVIGEPTSVIASLSKFETESFIDTALAYVPPVTATVEILGTTLTFHYDEDEERYFVKSSERSEWFVVPLWKAKNVLKQKEEFEAMKPAA